MSGVWPILVFFDKTPKCTSYTYVITKKHAKEKTTIGNVKVNAPVSCSTDTMIFTVKKMASLLDKSCE